MSSLNPVRLIAAKRDGEALTPESIADLVAAYTSGDVPDYQMSAFLMASFLNGLEDAEASALTDAMLHSGTVMDLSDTPATKVDKHSTGGVGDKVSLILAPIVTACGVPVPMVSGRGLGHTGGTLDKLESIPGFRTDLTMDEYRKQVRDLGICLIGQTDEMAPADRKLYALRDVTATVESIPLIAASIMSKKLAEGIDALVLDVKRGRGAFMKTDADARALAETLVAIGEEHDVPTTALLTAMDVPLGRAVGNWPEVAESVACLRGEHAGTPMMEVVLSLAAEMIALGREDDTPETAREKAETAVADGRALATFRTLVERQGGDTGVIDDPDSRPDADPAAVLRVPEGAGAYVTDLDALAVGHAAVDTGAGRRTKEDDVDPTAGFSDLKKPGDRVQPGDVLARIHTRHTDRLDALREDLLAAYTFGDEAPAATADVVDRFTARDGWKKGADE